MSMGEEGYDPSGNEKRKRLKIGGDLNLGTSRIWGL